MQTQDATSKTCQKRWMIEMNGEKELRKSVRLDDDDDLIPEKKVPVKMHYKKSTSKNCTIKSKSENLEQKHAAHHYTDVWAKSKMVHMQLN